MLWHDVNRTTKQDMSFIILFTRSVVTETVSSYVTSCAFWLQAQSTLRFTLKKWKREERDFAIKLGSSTFSSLSFTIVSYLILLFALKENLGLCDSKRNYKMKFQLLLTVRITFVSSYQHFLFEGMPEHFEAEARLKNI
jgi:hypothetical protein